MIRPGIRRAFEFLLHRRKDAERDVAAESRLHIDLRTEQLIRDGWPAATARAEAERRFAATHGARREFEATAVHRESRMRSRDWWESLAQDLRYAVRALAHERSFTAFIVITLALGIGANAAMFGVIDRLLIRGPEYISDPSRVLRFYKTVQREGLGPGTGNSFGWVSYDVFRTQTKSFSNVAAYSVNNIGFTYGSGADAVLVPFATVTHDLFPLLGVQPAAGRFFNAVEDSPDAPQPVVVLGYGLWRRAFGGSRDIIGQKVTFGDEPYTIVGVAPRGFTGPQLTPVDAWIPMSWRSRNVTTNWPKAWNAQWMRVIARLKDGVSPDQASTDATAAYRAAYTGTDAPQKTATLFLGPLSFDGQGHETTEVTISRWLVGVAVVVLLIACSNVANLLLARAIKRRREVAVRIALGAGRGRLVRLLLSESLLLAGAGAAVGLLVAWATALLMRNVLLPGLEWPSAPVDYRVLGVSIAIAVAVGLITGLVPAIRASRPDLTVALKSGAREGGGHSSRLRAGLTVAQAALSIVLLVGAGLFMRSLHNVRAIDLGLQPDRVLIATLRYPTPAPIGVAAATGERLRRMNVYREAMERARTLGGVENASLTIGLPFLSGFGQSLRVPGWDSIPKIRGPGPNISAVAHGYFETVGTRLVEGRTFTAADRDASEPVAIVSKHMAEILWRGKSPVGDCLYWGVNKDSLNTCSRIVGVVADVKSQSIREEPGMQYYIPFGQERGMGGTALIVRPRAGTGGEVTAAVRKLVADIDRSVSFVQVSSMQDAVDPQVRPWRLGAAIFALMGLLALVVAAVGLYSVMSYLVAQRTHEFGVRIALGARAGTIAFIVVRSSVAMAAAGIAIGTVAALLGGKYIEPLLFRVSPKDPFVLGGVAVTLLIIAFSASIVPAARARAVNPLDALRSE